MGGARTGRRKTRTEFLFLENTGNRSLRKLFCKFRRRDDTKQRQKHFIMAKAPIRIGIDLTPVLPGSENGGAKFATLEFIKTLLNDFADQFYLTLFVPEIALEELQAYFSGQ